MIIIMYLFFLHPVDYTRFESDITPFRLEDITFGCGRSVFATTATEADLQAATFVTLTFTTHNNGFGSKNIGHKASGEPLLCPNPSLLWRFVHLRDNKASPSTPLARVMTMIGMLKI